MKKGDRFYEVAIDDYSTAGKRLRLFTYEVTKIEPSGAFYTRVIWKDFESKERTRHEVLDPAWARTEEAAHTKAVPMLKKEIASLQRLLKTATRKKTKPRATK